MSRFQRQERQEALQKIVMLDPFFTDQELARRFGVSISTIRHDRGVLGIPELRERTRAVAHEAYETLKSLGEQEVIGELQELVIGEHARSQLNVDQTMVLFKAQVARGHHLFAQANSLAITLVDADVALTGRVGLKFLRPVHLGECVVARGQVHKRKGNKYWVEIISTVRQEEVLRGEWVLFAIDIPIRQNGEGNLI
ncbi:MAG: transcription factor FapR [Desulfitobacteriaceae bacterium]